jgi:lipoate-protein ligase B
VTRLLAVDLGRLDYHEALALQRALVERRRRGEGEDALLLCEHDEVITTGRRVQTAEAGGADDPGALAPARAAGLPVVEVERGGSATYHGPGQLVGYPIVALREGERDLHRVLRALEGAVAEAVAATTGLPAGPREGLTGVWSGDKKVCSIGIACRGWVTYHGFALNLDVDLSRFRLFRPCDLDAQVMASLASLGARPDRAALAARVHGALAERLGRVAAAGRLVGDEVRPA